MSLMDSATNPPNQTPELSETEAGLPSGGAKDPTRCPDAGQEPASNTTSNPSFNHLRELLDMIKFEHTVFALPFAFLGALGAAQGLPPLRTILWILAAMVGARTAAMTFNRLVDTDIDAENPRTASRALPAGRVSRVGAMPLMR